MTDFDGHGDDELAVLQAHTLFVIGPDGTLEAVNEADRPAPPRCFLSATRSTVRYWTAADPAPGLSAALESWRARLPAPLDLDTMTALPDELLAAIYGSDRPNVFTGPAYRFPGVMYRPPDVDERITIRLCPPGDAASFGDTFPEFTTALTHRQPVVAAFDRGRPVSVCLAARATSSACEAGVETTPTHRGRGLAPTVTYAWAELVRRSGRTPLYSAAWENTSSQAVARRLGLIRYAVTMSFY